MTKKQRNPIVTRLEYELRMWGDLLGQFQTARDTHKAIELAKVWDYAPEIREDKRAAIEAVYPLPFAGEDFAVEQYFRLQSLIAEIKKNEPHL